MKDADKILLKFDKTIGTNQYDIDRTQFPLLIRIFEQFREDMYVESQEYEELKLEKQNIENTIDKSFNDEQKQLFEQYWEIESKMQSEIEKVIFLFGYLIRDELENELKNVKK